MPLTSRNVDLCAVLRIAFRRNRRRTFLFIIYFKWLFWICLSIVSARWCSHWRTISALYGFDLRPAVGVGLEHIKIWAFLESLMNARQFLGSRKVNILSDFWIVNSDILAAWITPMSSEARPTSALEIFLIPHQQPPKWTLIAIHVTTDSTHFLSVIFFQAHA